MQKLNCSKHFPQNESGSVLVGVIAMAIVMAMACLGYLQVSTSTANAVLTEQEDSKAFHAAESGLLAGARWLAKSVNREAAMEELPGTEYDNIMSSLSINGYTVQVSITRTADNLLIGSGASAGAKLGYNKILNQNALPAVAPFDTAAMENAMFSDGNIKVTGTSKIDEADGTKATIHSNSNISVEGTPTVATNLSASGQVSIGGNATFDPLTCDSSSNATNIPFPEIDLSKWRAYAQANGAVYSGSVANPTKPATGNVIWVDGDVSISNANYEGYQIIATGDISVSGGTSLNAPDSGFALASVNGNIDITISYHSNPSPGRGWLKGLVYAQNGIVSISSNSEYSEPQVIARDSIYIAGTSGATLTLVKTIPVFPGDEGFGVELLAGSWQESNIVP